MYYQNTKLLTISILCILYILCILTIDVLIKLITVNKTN